MSKQTLAIKSLKHLSLALNGLLDEIGNTKTRRLLATHKTVMMWEIAKLIERLVSVKEGS